jgi:hypothetical protein
MLIRVLECLHQSHRLLGIASYWQVGDFSMPHDALVADDECSTESNTLVTAGIFLYTVILKAKITRKTLLAAHHATWQTACFTSASSGNFSLPMPP